MFNTKGETLLTVLLRELERLLGIHLFRYLETMAYDPWPMAFAGFCLPSQIPPIDWQGVGKARHCRNDRGLAKPPPIPCQCVNASPNPCQSIGGLGEGDSKTLRGRSGSSFWYIYNTSKNIT